MSEDKTLPCPFCGGTELRTVDWADETGEYDAIECSNCLGTAPASQWNNRSNEDVQHLRKWLREMEDVAREQIKTIQRFHREAEF